MLNEFLKGPYPQQRENNFLTIPEIARESVKEFDGIVDFLRDPVRFPNKEINDLMSFAWRSIGNGITPATLSIVESFGFYLDPYGLPQFGPDLPVEFEDDVKREPIMQIAKMVNIGSRIRDYNLFGQPLDDAASKRAYAFESEAILEMKKMAEKEGYDLLLNDILKDVLAKYPEGIKSLPSELYYETPQTIEIKGQKISIYPEWI